MNWRKSWTFSLVLFCGTIVPLEAYLRWAGHRPSVTDDKRLWANHRSRIYRNDGNVLVLLGASRIQIGFDTDVFRQRFPESKIVQLAIDGTSPLASLRDLAADSEFTGTVICSVTAQNLDVEKIEDQQAWIDLYHQQTRLDGALNRDIATEIQSRLALANPLFRLTRMGEELFRTGQLPSPLYVITLADRSRRADYTMRSEKQLQQSIEAAQNVFAGSCQMTVEAWLEQAKQIESMVDQIQARGGDVVFLRMPTSGKIWERDDKLTPKAEYWDAFAAMTSAQTIHFHDLGPLNQFECPDGSHLDQRDAPKFTNALLDELVKRKLIMN